MQSEINLQNRIQSAPLIRSWDIPQRPIHVCCVVLQADLDLLPAFMAAYPACKVNLLLIPDLAADSPEFMRLAGIGRLIPACSLENARQAHRLEKVLLFNPGPEAEAVTAALCRVLSVFGIHKIYLYDGQKRSFGLQAPVPNYYHQNQARLERVYELLADEASRQIFAGRIKALISGDAGYLPLSDHQEYYHPLVHPEAGDIMLDGGVSDMVEAQKQFARSVGENGRIFGFEPIADMAATACGELADFPRYELHTAALGESKGQAAFANLRDSSHMTPNSAAGSILCQMTSVDDFVKEHGLDRVNCLKLDVEGAETLAIAGARQTILRHRPKLIICLYHKPSDLFDIPLYIHNLDKKYQLYMAHSSCGFTDTILYAKVADA